MTEIAPIPSAPHNAPLYVASGGRLASAADPAVAESRRSAETAGRTAERPSDRVDISERARLLGKLASLPPIRQELVDRIKDQIAAGDYDTDERFDIALEQLLDEVG